MAMSRNVKIGVIIGVVLLTIGIGALCCVGGLFAFVFNLVKNSGAVAAFEQQVEGQSYENIGVVTDASLSPWGSMNVNTSSSNGVATGRAEFTVNLETTTGQHRYQVRMALQPDGTWTLVSTSPALVPEDGTVEEEVAPSDHDVPEGEE